MTIEIAAPKCFDIDTLCESCYGDCAIYKRNDMAYVCQRCGVNLFLPISFDSNWRLQLCIDCRESYGVIDEGRFPCGSFPESEFEQYQKVLARYGDAQR